MPWTPERYPASMKRLDPLVREKAIEIANALLEQGHPEGQAIRIAIARARAWARHRGLDTEYQLLMGERSGRGYGSRTSSERFQGHDPSRMRASVGDVSRR